MDKTIFVYNIYSLNLLFSTLANITHRLPRDILSEMNIHQPPLQFEINYCTQESLESNFTSRDFRKADYEAINSNLSHSDWQSLLECSDCDYMVHKFH